MGPVTSTIKQLAFDNQSTNDQNLQRLNFTYKEYKKRDENFFYTLDEYVKNEPDNQIRAFLIENDLQWPEDEAGLIGGDGLFNQLNEDQAAALSSRIQDLLPKFANA